METNALTGINLNLGASSSFLKSETQATKVKDKLQNLQNLQNNDKSHKEIVSAAKDFEALLLNQMINEMWKSVPNDGLFGKSQEQEYFQEVLKHLVTGKSNTEIAKEISMGNGLGIQDMVIAELEKKK